MKIKISEATNNQLNWLVAKCEGLEIESINVWAVCCLTGEREHSTNFNPSTNWAQGGAIIERERLNLRASGAGDWIAMTHDIAHPDRRIQYGDTPLIAAMRCLVCAKLGDEVEVPDNLR